MAVREIIFNSTASAQHSTAQHSDCAFFSTVVFIKGNG